MGWLTSFSDFSNFTEGILSFQVPKLFCQHTSNMVTMQNFLYIFPYSVSMAETVIFFTERALFLFWVTKKLDLSFLPEHQTFQDFQFGGKRRGWAGGFVLDGALKDPLVHYRLLILSTAPLEALIDTILIFKHLTIQCRGVTIDLCRYSLQNWIGLYIHRYIQCRYVRCSHVKIFLQSISSTFQNNSSAHSKLFNSVTLECWFIFAL